MTKLRMRVKKFIRSSTYNSDGTLKSLPSRDPTNYGRFVKSLSPVYVITSGKVKLYNPKQMVGTFGLDIGLYLTMSAKDYYVGLENISTIPQKYENNLRIVLDNKCPTVKGKYSGITFIPTLCDKTQIRALLDTRIVKDEVKNVLVEHFDITYTYRHPQLTDQECKRVYNSLDICLLPKVVNDDGKLILKGVRPIMRTLSSKSALGPLTDTLGMILKLIPNVTNNTIVYRRNISDGIKDANAIMFGDIKSMFTSIEISKSLTSLREVILRLGREMDYDIDVNIMNSFINKIKYELTKPYLLQHKYVLTGLKRLPMGHRLSPHLAIIHVGNLLYKSKLPNDKFTMCMYVDDLTIMSRKHINNTRTMNVWGRYCRSKINRAFGDLIVNWEAPRLFNSEPEFLGNGKIVRASVKWSTTSIGFRVNSSKSIVYSPRRRIASIIKFDHTITKSIPALAIIPIVTNSLHDLTNRPDIRAMWVDNTNVTNTIMYYMHNIERETLKCFGLFHATNFIDFNNDIGDHIPCGACHILHELLKLYMSSIVRVHNNYTLKNRNVYRDREAVISDTIITMKVSTETTHKRRIAIDNGLDESDGHYNTLDDANGDASLIPMRLLSKVYPIKIYTGLLDEIGLSYIGA